VSWCLVARLSLRFTRVVAAVVARAAAEVPVVRPVQVAAPDRRAAAVREALRAQVAAPARPAERARPSASHAHHRPAVLRMAREAAATATVVREGRTRSCADAPEPSRFAWARSQHPVRRASNVAQEPATGTADATERPSSTGFAVRGADGGARHVGAPRGRFYRDSLKSVLITSARSVSLGSM